LADKVSGLARGARIQFCAFIKDKNFRRDQDNSYQFGVMMMRPAVAVQISVLRLRGEARNGSFSPVFPCPRHVLSVAILIGRSLGVFTSLARAKGTRGQAIAACVAKAQAANPGDMEAVRAARTAAYKACMKAAGFKL
jgi:hypothetical protein